jgi:hypothetical protein
MGRKAYHFWHLSNFLGFVQFPWEGIITMRIVILLIFISIQAVGSSTKNGLKLGLADLV